MPRVYILNLQTADRSSLNEIVSRGQNWRCRERAQTLLLLDDGMAADTVADKLGVHRRTVWTTRRDWFKFGFDSLADLPRSGSPKKISPEQLEKIAAAANAEPLSARQLLAMHVDGGGSPVAQSTLAKALKAAGFVWKRTRHSLKKNVMKPPSKRQRSR